MKDKCIKLHEKEWEEYRIKLIKIYSDSFRKENGEDPEPESIEFIEELCKSAYTSGFYSILKIIKAIRIMKKEN